MAFKSAEDRTTKIKNVIKENQKLIRNISNRIKNINKRYDSTPFTEDFLKIYGIGKDINQRNMKNSEILKFHEQLLMLNRKSYTRVNKYAKYDELQNALTDIGVDEERVWRLYDQIVEERVIMNEKYKYEVVRYMSYMMSRGLSDQEIRDRVFMIEDKIYGQTSSDDFKKLQRESGNDDATFTYNQFLELVDLS